MAFYLFSCCISFYNEAKNIIVEENKVYANDIGIEATSEHANRYAEDISILHNEIYNNHFTGISVGGYDEERGGTKNSVIAENVLYRNDTKGLDGGQLLMQHNSKNIRIERNIFTAGPTRIFIANYFDTIHNNTWKQNVFHDEEGKEGIWIWKNKSYTSFPDFQKVSNSDEESRYMEIEDIDFILEKPSLGG
ncbi:right-handed parallel beta-helix repeat-containing protein [Oceanobacillus sp. AG]|uniref:right-handed parallel beta-helix repeat-containing protein n=1 Tax=Oceanobacillus sp. AG TaxID=2681969 RepID=UPI0012EB8CF0|nr:right-handed parallel beta-helix repeat-containing protein [Oceanobacillus sp. AG]